MQNMATECYDISIILAKPSALVIMLLFSSFPSFSQRDKQIVYRETAARCRHDNDEDANMLMLHQIWRFEEVPDTEF